MTDKTLHAKSVRFISSTNCESQVIYLFRPDSLEVSTLIVGLAESQSAPERRFLHNVTGLKPGRCSLKGHAYVTSCLYNILQAFLYAIRSTLTNSNIILPLAGVLIYRLRFIHEFSIANEEGESLCLLRRTKRPVTKNSYEKSISNALADRLLRRTQQSVLDKPARILNQQRTS